MIYGDYPTAETYFRRSVYLAPLNGDTYIGLGVVSSQGEANAKIATDIQHIVSPRFQLTSTRQLLCWALFFLGIVWHSRQLALLCASVLTVSVLLGVWLGSSSSPFSDVAFLLNVLPLFLAFGGQYLRFSLLGLGWSIFLSLFLALSWSLLPSIFATAGLPLLCFPFNLLLLITLLSFRYIPACRRILVPLEVATTNPEAVRVYFVRVQIANHCWSLLRAT